MSKHYITLGNGRRVTISSYVTTVKYAKAHPDAIFTHGLCSADPVTGQMLFAEFQIGLIDRINKRGKIDVHRNYDWHNDSRVIARMQRNPHYCAWCGNTVSHYNPNTEHNFCSTDCQRAYSY